MKLTLGLDLLNPAAIFRHSEQPLCPFVPHRLHPGHGQAAPHSLGGENLSGPGNPPLFNRGRAHSKENQPSRRQGEKRRNYSWERREGKEENGLEEKGPDWEFYSGERDFPSMFLDGLSLLALSEEAH